MSNIDVPVTEQREPLFTREFLESYEARTMDLYRKEVLPVLRQIFGEQVLPDDFRELPLHDAQLASINRCCDNPNDYQAHLASDIQLFKPVQLSRNRRGVINIGFSAACLFFGWLGCLWGHWEAFSRKERRLRSIIAVSGFFLFVWFFTHGIILLAHETGLMET